MAEKYLRVKMPDGSKWDVPARTIAEDRAKHYAELDVKRGDASDYQAAFKDEVQYALDDAYQIKDWASNNMNWADVAGDAVLAVAPPATVDYEAGWANHEDWEVVEL